MALDPLLEQPPVAPRLLTPDFNKVKNSIESVSSINAAARTAYSLFGNSSFFREAEKWSFLSPLLFSPTFNPETIIGIYDQIQTKIYTDGVKAHEERVASALVLKQKFEDADNNEIDLSDEEIYNQHVLEQNTAALDAEEELAYKLGLASRPVSADYEPVLDPPVIDTSNTENFKSDEPNKAVITPQNSDNVQPRSISSTNVGTENGAAVSDYEDKIAADVNSAAPPAPPDPRGDFEYQKYKGLGDIPYNFAIQE